MRHPQSVQVFLICRRGSVPNFLLLRRRAQPDLGLSDFWQGVTGALKVGESYLDAALREVWEETGIRLEGAIDAGFEHSFPIRPQWQLDYGPAFKRVQERVFYGILTDCLQPVISPEHKDWRWCTYQEAKALLTFGANARCLQAVRQHYRARTA